MAFDDFDLADVEDIIYYEERNEPGFAFIVNTLAPYLRILYRIDPNLHIPETSTKHFAIGEKEYGCYGMIFMAPRPTPMTSEEDESYNSATETERVQDINKVVYEYLIKWGWIDTYPSDYPKRYDIDQLYDLFIGYRKTMNDVKFIECGAKFVSTVYNLTGSNATSDIPFVKFTKGTKQCEKDFAIVFEQFDK